MAFGVGHSGHNEPLKRWEKVAFAILLLLGAIIMVIGFCGCTSTEPLVLHYADPKTILPPSAPTVSPAVQHFRSYAPWPFAIIPAQTTYNLPDFRYAVDPCLYTWTLQGSSNLVNWVDLDHRGSGCPTVPVDVTNITTPYFFRLKGTVVQPP